MLEWANQYFSNLLYAEAWNDASIAERQKALNTGKQVIDTLRLAQNVPPRAYKSAICEQALYLLEQTAGDRTREKLINQGVASRSVGGASETYRHNRSSHISGSAMQMILPWIRRRTGGIR